MSLKFALIMKTKPLFSGNPNQSNWQVWLRKCKHQVRLRHSMTSMKNR
jgi:hypothetical protein